MGKFLFAVVAAFAFLVLAESLICNRCRFGLFGTCPGRDNETCATNVSVCFTQRLILTSDQHQSPGREAASGLEEKERRFLVVGLKPRTKSTDMGKFLFAVVAAFASLVLAESLICNRCRFGLFGTCLGRDNETCATNVSVCFTERTTFITLPDFVGFNSQGCKDTSTGCNVTTSGTLLGVTLETKTTCCNLPDRCNTIVLNGAPSTKMTFTAAIGAGLLASVWGSLL
ncbi:uncharacterized protein LOC124879661 [Girardinichthys multiradiatus]|uniref:uncharacterized protein LOC124879661 n=1 Tax=Girardinichthys multiradiatus TaxID=208333 RepID=UPI001FADBB2E|nr:uncharacterized protein LOC124879661 [Girardinichthys multiradiatus]